MTKSMCLTKTSKEHNYDIREMGYSDNNCKTKFAKIKGENNIVS